MGKIKGWTKIADTSKTEAWKNDNKPVKIVLKKDDTIKGVTIIKKSIFGGGFLDVKGEPFTNEEKARKFAINYMKSHPNG